MLRGGCQCGAVRYEIDPAEILTLYCCHCRECQRQSGSAFGQSMIVPRSAFHLTAGELARWQRGTDSGRINRAHFCAGCGCRIYHDDGGEGDKISLKAGSLDDTGNLRPVGHIWTKRSQPWIAFSDQDQVFPGQPDDYAPLVDAWRRRNRAP